MGRTKRTRGRAAVAVPAVAAAPVMSAGMTGFIVGGSSYFGAQTSDDRRDLILPDKDERLGLRADARTLLALKSRVFAENYGPGAALMNLASMIGALKVQSISGDEAWSAIAEDYFNRQTGSGLLFDAGGRVNFSMWQVLSSYREFVDGDMFTVYTQSPTSGRARVMGYEGLCVEQGPDCKGPQWVDGVECDPVTRFPLRYCFVQRDRNGVKKYSMLPGRVVHHHMTNRSFSAVRGRPALAHCLNNFQDIIETTAFQKKALKIAAMIGLTPEDNTSMGPLSQMGVAAPLQRETVYLPPTTAATATQPPIRATYEQAIEGGLITTRRMKAVHDERPHPNGEKFKEQLLREGAIGLGMAPQLLFFMDDPSGAYSRIILELAAKTITDHHVQRLAPWCRRSWAYVVARGMAIGDIPEPQSGDWLKIKLTPPRMPTADLGRMGRLYIELRKTCLQNHRGIYEELGLDYEDELDQCGREMRLMMDIEEKYKLPPGSMTNALLPMGQSMHGLENPDQGANGNP